MIRYCDCADIMQRTRGSLASSFSPTSPTFLAKQQVVLQRMTNDVPSAKNFDISDNSAADLSYRQRLQDRRRCRIRNTCLYLSFLHEEKRVRAAREEDRSLSSPCGRAADSPRRRVTLSPVTTVIVFILLYRTALALYVIHRERRAYYEYSHLRPRRGTAS
ncbi:PREDICTED: uncharacterized protein LOC105568155 [Vollenhovia emeryi]|uniref:uncharacterized protein LOC105568155 n=1 Tax=Vollenhovia emeryi TaxID=411798 RepID=UPI0005F43BE7|nr:PREDICTED: uncharacterized protein LOC105568155 [Vollenhovia emeryi]